ncbi:hypothetical protein Barb6XT_01371 [Bacteroidales bacterium Barb6XT]|nr:hypothetical protein Barb6XT_01371 [Bacteroidales bacterium Barb6XT]
MRTLSIAISDIDCNKFHIKKDNMDFPDLVKIVSMELDRQNLDECVKLAEKYGLSTMTMDEITDEVKAVRRDAKNCH